MTNQLGAPETRAAERSYGDPRKVALLVLVGYLLIAAYQSAPALSDPLHRTIGGGRGDAAIFLWFLAHTSQSVFHAHGHGLLFTHALNYPAGVNAMWNTGLLLPALLLAPVTAFVGPGTSLVAIFFLGPPLSAWSAYVCSAPYLRRVSARCVAGLVFGFSPAVMAAQLGHYQLTLLMLVPPILLLTVDSATGRRRPRRTGLLLGAALGCQVLIGEEVLAFTVISAAVVLVLLVLQRRALVRERLKPFVRTAGWAVLPVVAVAGYPLWGQFFGPQRVHGVLQPLDTLDLDPAQLIVPTKVMQFQAGRVLGWLHPLTVYESERMGYLGLPLFVLLVLVVVRRRHDLVVRTAGGAALILAVLALGYTLHLNGVATGLPMPWRITARLPVLGNVLPGRWLLIIDLLVGLLVGLAVDALPTGGKNRWLGGLLIALCLLPLLPRQALSALPTNTPAFFTADGKNLRGTVLVLPYPFPQDATAMTWAAVAGTGFAMPGGYFVGPNRQGLAVFGTRPPRPSIVTLQSLPSASNPLTIDASQRAQFLRDVDYWKATTIVLGPMRNRSLYLAYLTAMLRREPALTGDIYIWRNVHLG